MKRPLAGLVAAYAVGIWVGSVTGWPATTVFYAVAGLLVAFLALQKTRFGLVALIGAVFAAGVLGYRHATTISSPTDITRLLERRDQNVTLRGIIISDTGYREERLDETAPDRQRFDLELTGLYRNGQWQPASGRIFVFVSESRETLPVRYGDLVNFSAILRVPPPPRNPGVFDWRAWLERRGIHFTATIRQNDSLEVEAHEGGNPVIRLSIRLREELERALRLGLEDEPKPAGVLAGMVLGERSEIPPETYADFQHTGVFRVFAINGLHVGLVTGIALIVLRFVRIPRRWCGIVAVPLLILYVFATGAHYGAVRALVMACVWLIGGMLVRPVNVLNSLAAAALVILIYEPTQLFDGGFILSFAVVAAIVTLTPRIEALLLPLVATDPLLPRQFVPRWRTTLDAVVRRVVQLLSCSLAAWVGLLPLMAVYFHLLLTVSIVANLLVIPLLGCVIALGLLATLAHAVWPWLTLTLTNANFFLLSIMIRSVEKLGSLGFGHWFVQTPPAWCVWAYYGLGVLLLSKWMSTRRRRMAAVLAVPCIGAGLFFSVGRDEGATLTVLALNDGASVFLDNPGERPDVLIDGGSDWSGSHVVVPFLRARGVDRLIAMMLTRGDKAHAAGLGLVAQEVPTREAIYSGVASRSKFFDQWLEDMKACGIPRRVVKAGDELSFARGARVRVLNPPRGITTNRSEDNALVLVIEFGPTRVLHMSDAGETVEKRLLKSSGDLHAQVIIKGQHGTETSCTPEFLDAVRPEAVVQAVGIRPSSRYPDPGLRDRLVQRNIALYRTDDAGAVTIRLRQDGYDVRTFLGRIGNGT